MLAAAFAMLLAAQTPATQTPLPDILVTAPRQADAATVERYVREISYTTGGQLAALRDPVCPAVFGLPENYAERVKARIRAVASQAGMDLAAAGCTPNVTMIVANNSLRAVQEMQRLDPRLFNGLSSAELARVTRGDGGVRAWSLTEVRNEDGTDFATGDSGDSGRATGGGPNPDSTMRVTNSSIITLPTQRVITQSIVVVEEQATVGKTLTQLADYVSMRAIAGTRTDGAIGQGNSILALFGQDAPPPRSLTSLDLAYLAALDETRGNQRATSHLNRIARLISGRLTTQGQR